MRLRREIFIEIRHDDFQHSDGTKVGRLNLSLYCTRDAAQNSVRAYTEVLTKSGFETGKYSAQNFWHPEKDIAVSVHGDDFSATADEESLKWLESV